MNKDRVRLLVAKPTGFDLLAFQAKKHGGLGCARFTVSRIGEKSSAIGDSFEFQGKEERQALRNRYFRVVQATEEEIAAGKRPSILFATLFVFMVSPFSEKRMPKPAPLLDVLPYSCSSKLISSSEPCIDGGT